MPAVQSLHSVWPIAFCHSPAGHCAQIDVPLVEAKVPALQLVGVSLPVEQYAPAGQRSQSVPSSLLLIALA